MVEFGSADKGIYEYLIRKMVYIDGHTKEDVFEDFFNDKNAMYGLGIEANDEKSLWAFINNALKEPENSEAEEKDG